MAPDAVAGYDFMASVPLSDNAEGRPVPDADEDVRLVPVDRRLRQTPENLASFRYDEPLYRIQPRACVMIAQRYTDANVSLSDLVAARRFPR